jgi:hypothetical protein
MKTIDKNITQAWVDGAVFPVAQLAHHAFGIGTFTNLRVVDAAQAAGSSDIHQAQAKLAQARRAQVCDFFHRHELILPVRVAAMTRE